MDLVRYDEPPHVRLSNSASLNSSVDGSVDSHANSRTVHFDQITPTMDPDSAHNRSTTVVTARDGEPVVVKEHTVERDPTKSVKKNKRTMAPISTGYAMGPWPVVVQPSNAPRTVREKHLRLYVIASIVACIVFLPTGVAALYFAYKTKKEFYAGLEARGEVSEKAIKCSRRCEKLLILTGICAVLLAVVIFAVVEKITNDRTVTHRISNAPQ